MPYEVEVGDPLFEEYEEDSKGEENKEGNAGEPQGDGEPQDDKPREKQERDDSPPDMDEETTGKSAPSKDTEDKRGDRYSHFSKIEKDNARLAYELRESKRRLKFLEEQFMEQQKRQVKSSEEAEFQEKLKGIEHLRDTDIERYFEEREKLNNERWEKRFSEVMRAIEADREIERFAREYQRANDQLEATYPELKDRNSELFRETRAFIEQTYTPEEIASIVRENPYAMQGIVERIHAQLRARQSSREDAERQRRERINGQGNVPAKPKAGKDPVSILTPDQKKWCRDHNIDPKIYAKFVAERR